MGSVQREGKIDQLRGRIRSTWGDVTDDDIDRSKGSLETLVGTIKEKTGEAAETIEEKLNELLDDDHEADDSEDQVSQGVEQRQ